MFRILAITVTLLVGASAVHADVYRWVDSRGTVQYSDRWVPGSVLVKTDSSRSAATATEEPTPAPAGATPGTDAPADRASEIIANQQAERAMQQDLAKAKNDQCKKATEAYQKAIESRRLYKDGANGNREYLSDADANAYRLNLFNARRQACGS